MMWGMMLACAVPLIIIAFVGSGRSSPILWTVIGLGGMFILHWVVMKAFRRSDHSDKTPTPPAAPDGQTPPDTDRPHVH